MKKHWSKTIPTKEGWYWVRYKGKHGITVQPAELTILDSLGSILTSYRMTWKKYEQAQFCYQNEQGRFVPDETLYYGPEIIPPAK